MNIAKHAPEPQSKGPDGGPSFLHTPYPDVDITPKVGLPSQSSPNYTQRTKEVVVVDTSVADWQTLARGVSPTAEIALIGLHEDGMRVLAETLRERSGVSALHVISHGSAGQFMVGATFVSKTSLSDHADAIGIIRGALADKADILLYGCCVGAGCEGRAFIDAFARATGADVAASASPTGNRSLGGDWQLECATGAIYAPLVVSSAAQTAFAGILNAPVLSPSTPSFPTITEDNTTNAGEQVSNLLGGSVSDTDDGAAEGIAVTDVTSGNGRWQYSIDGGATWSNVGAVEASNALLLRASDFLRFVPDGDNGTSGEVTYRAWDQTSGSAGTTVDASTAGGTTAFSTDTDTASITVTDVNDAPVAQADELTTDEEITIASGDTFADNGNGVDNDVDTDDNLTVSAVNGAVGNLGTAVTGSNGGQFTIQSGGGLAFDPNGAFENLAVGESRTSTAAYTITDGSLSDTATVTVTVNGINDAPTAVDDTNSTAADEAINRAAINGVIGSNDTDPDLTDSLTVTTVDNGLIIDLAGAPVRGTDGGVFRIDPDGSYTFAPDGDFDGLSTGDSRNTSVTYAISDGEGGSDTASLVVTVTGLNDAPTLSTTADNPTFTEGSAPVTPFSGATVDAIESGQAIVSFTFTVTNLADGSDEAALVDGTDIALTNTTSGTTTGGHSLDYSVTVAGTTATVTISGGMLSPADAQTLINTVAYRNDSGDPSTASTRDFKLTEIVDSGGVSNGGDDTGTPTGGTSSVTLEGVNDPPMIGNLNSDTAAVQPGSGANKIDDGGDATVTNVDSDDYNGGFLAITDNGANNTANGNFAVDGTAVTAGGDARIAAGETVAIGGIPIGTVDAINDGQGGNSLEIAFNEDATNARVQTLLQNIGWSAAAGSGSQTFTATLNDADGTANGGDQDTAANFTMALSEKPTLGGASADTTVLEDTSTAIDLSAYSVADIDGDTVTLTLTVGAGTIAATDGNGTTGGVTIANSGTASMTIVGSLTDLNAYLNDATKIEYTPVENSTSATTLTVTPNDGLIDGAADTVAITVKPVNDAPTASATITPTELDDDAGAQAIFGNVTIGDVDVGETDLSVDIRLSNPVAGTISGGGFTDQGNGVYRLTSQTPASATTALDSVTFSPISNDGSSGTFGTDVTIAVNDQDAAEVIHMAGTMTITRINDAPTGSDGTTSVRTNQTLVVEPRDFGFADVDGGDQLASISINAVPVSGALFLDNADLRGSGGQSDDDTFQATEEVQAGDMITRTQIYAGDLIYDPDATGAQSLQFTVNDGTVSAAAGNTLTINVTNPPSGGGGGEDNGGEEDGAAVDRFIRIGPNGDPQQIIEIGPVPEDRSDEPGTPNGDLADIEVGNDTGGENDLSLGLPTGTGARVAGQTRQLFGEDAQQDLTARIEAETELNSSDRAELTDDGERFLGRIPSDTAVTVRTVTPSFTGDGMPGPIAITGSDSKDSVEAMVLDLSDLPSGTVINLNNVNFVTILGDGMLIQGGAGNNDVTGDSNSQIIVLGPGDDVLRGGGGDDEIGSKGGDDQLFGGPSDDTVRGGADDDLVDGGPGADWLFGDQGSDTLVAGDGDTLVGGLDDDRVELAGFTGTLTWVDPTPGDTLVLSDLDLTSAQVHVDSQELSVNEPAVLRLDLDGDDSFADDEPAIVLGRLARAEVAVQDASGGGTAIQLPGPDLPLADLAAEDQLASLYVAYFGRAADPAGLAFWKDRFESALDEGDSALQALTAIAEDFRFSEEAFERFPVLDPAAPTDSQGMQGFVESVYESLFNRAPEQAGLDFWTEQFQARVANGQDIGTLLITIMAAAGDADTPDQANDASTVRNKIEAAGSLTDALDASGLALGADIGLDQVHQLLADTDGAYSSFETALEEIQALTTTGSDDAAM